MFFLYSDCQRFSRIKFEWTKLFHFPLCLVILFWTKKLILTWSFQLPLAERIGIVHKLSPLLFRWIFQPLLVLLHLTSTANDCKIFFLLYFWKAEKFRVLVEAHFGKEQQFCQIFLTLSLIVRIYDEEYFHLLQAIQQKSCSSL